MAKPNPYSVDYRRYSSGMKQEKIEELEEKSRKRKQAKQKSPTNRNEDEKALMQAREHRQLAKSLGGKALTGTSKQKAWAERIRFEFLSYIQRLNDISHNPDIKWIEDDELALILNAPQSQRAEFWIDLEFCDWRDVIAVLQMKKSYASCKAFSAERRREQRERKANKQ